ncbi:MAG: 50S ribosomal protein L35ae [Candidatus Micrarchaeota archaeon]|nr:50S ribosomal protein L35ae [Candidatus Micrarchaeota archaeon]
MEAKLLDYRGGRHTQTTDEFIVKIEGVSSRSEASKLAGRKIVWTTPADNKINGKITHAHGGKGTVIARFDKGLPGQAIGTNAEVEG